MIPTYRKESDSYGLWPYRRGTAGLSTLANPLARGSQRQRDERRKQRRNEARRKKAIKKRQRKANRK